MSENNRQFAEIITKAVARGRSSGVVAVIDDQGMDKALELIADGLEYGTDELGFRVTSSMASTRLDKPQVRRLLQAIIKSGFNPLIKTNDKNELFEMDTFPDAIEAILSDLEGRGQGLRDEQGNNLYHVMASKRMTRLHMLLEQTKESLASPLEEEAKAAMAGRFLLVNGVREDGGTPLHALWETGNPRRGLLIRMLSSRSLSSEDLLKLREATKIAAKCTLELIGMGADILAKDRNGVSAWSLIDQQEPVGKESHPLVKQIREHAMDRLIEVNTPAATGSQKPRLRL